MILTRTDVSSFNIDEVIDSAVKRRKLHELLILVPTNRKVRYMKRDLINRSPSRCCGRINLETLGTLTSKLLFESSSAKDKVLSEAASAVLIRQSFQEVSLEYFSAYENDIPVGTLQRVRSVISQYKRHGITPEILLNESEKLDGAEKLKAIDIAAIYKNYSEKCREIGVKEIGDVYRELLELNSEEFRERLGKQFPDVKTVIASGFDELTLPEVRILTILSEASPLFISFDYYKNNKLLFGHLDKCYDLLISNGFVIIEDKSENPTDNFKKKIREKLFLGATPEKYDDLRDNIIWMTATDREEEIKIIAKEIKDLITTGGQEPHKIAVTFNLIQNYSDKIRDIFTVYGIPFNLTDRFRLSASQPVLSVINYLEIAENDFYYKNIFRALSGSYLEKGTINLSNLMNAASELRIISGYNNWRDSLTQAIYSLSTESDEYSGGKAESFKKALNDIRQIHSHLSAFYGKMSLAEFREKLENLVFSQNLPVNIINESAGDPERSIKAVSVFIKTISELFDIFHLEYGSEKKFPLKFFLSHLRTAIATARYNIKEKPDYGVQVTTLNEIRGIEFDYLFISGMVDGDMPLRYTPEIFFSGDYQRKEVVHQTEQRYLFYQALCSWKKKLYLTHPLKEDKKDLVVSNFLTGFQNLYSATLITPADFTDIYSNDELLRTAGRAGIDKFNKHFPGIFSEQKTEEMLQAISVDNIRITAPYSQTNFTGWISGLSDEAAKRLTELKDTQYSITQLEKYAACPYKYFAESVLRLNVPEEPSEEFEAVEMGTLLHKILFEFYTRLTKQGKTVADCSDDEFNNLLDILFTIAEDKVKEANLTSPLSFFEKEKILGVNGKREQSLMFLFLQNERTNHNNYIPAFLEAGFGQVRDESGRYSTFIENFRIEDVSVRGKIDRIDINTSNNTFKVIDYKSGHKTASVKDIMEGNALQLPVYMQAARTLINSERKIGMKPAAPEYYLLVFSKEKFRKELIKNYSTLKSDTEEELTEKIITGSEEMIKAASDAIKKYVQQITGGRFNLTQLPENKRICNYCSFRTMCRIDDAAG